MDLLKLIQEAHQRIRGVVNPTPIVYSETFSHLFGCEVFFKLENLQKTGSFKSRGAYNRIQTLSPEQRRRGVVAASSGNHAQGVAWAATLSGVSSTVVMPETTPIVKRVATRGYGAEIILHGASFSDSYEYALEISREKGLTLIHPFEDEFIMAGQGTIGLEILDDLPDVDTVLVPVGGGGLISGVACALKERACGVRVVGVQARAWSSCARSLERGRIVESGAAPTIADGIAIKRVGKKTLRYIRKYVDEVVTVGEETIAEAVLKLLERKKLMVEGAGAVPLAALMEGKVRRPGRRGKTRRKTLLLLSGGNIDVTTLDRIIRRGLSKEGRVVKLSTILPDVPGSLAAFTAEIAALRSNILHILHERDAVDLPIGSARLEIIIEVEGRGHTETVIKRLKEKGYFIEEA